MKKLYVLLALIMAFAFTATEASAKRHKAKHYKKAAYSQTVDQSDNDGRYFNSNYSNQSFSTGSYGGSRPSGCPSAWCGCWLSLQIYGENRRELWAARAWLGEGSAASPGCVGCVAVLTRGRSKSKGHVGIVTGYNGRNPIIKSGNHNRTVGVAEYPAGRVLGYRRI